MSATVRMGLGCFLGSVLASMAAVEALAALELQQQPPHPQGTAV